MRNKWIEWATTIQSIAQAGLTYSKDKYDIERFNQLLDLSAEIISDYSDMNFKKVKDILSLEDGYLTPKIDVRGAIIKDDKILLVKESIDGLYSMPGGWADINLSLSENIIKEAKEEAGAIVKPIRVIAIQDRNRYNKPEMICSIYKIFVLCELVEYEFISNTETEECGLFAMEELPQLSEGRNNLEQIKMCFESYYDDSLKTIFD